MERWHKIVNRIEKDKPRAAEGAWFYFREYCKFFPVKTAANDKLSRAEGPKIISCNIDIAQYLDSHISAICSNEYHNDDDNHCAHFVSHILGFRFGYVCRNQTGKGSSSTTANIKVHQVFEKCKTVGKWADKPIAVSFCLAFVTSSSNVNLTTGKMRNIPRKHIGVYHGSHIYHYSNGQNKVVKQTPAAFANHYAGNDITVYYGSIPGKLWND